MTYVKKASLGLKQEPIDDKKITVIKARAAKPRRKTCCKCKKASPGKKAHSKAKNVWMIVSKAFKNFWRMIRG